MRTVRGLHLADQRPERLARHRHALEQQQTDQARIPLRDMAPHGKAAALFSSDQGVLLPHGGGDELEPDRCDDQRHSQRLRLQVHHAADVDRLDDRSALPTVPDEVPDKQREDLMRGDDVSVFVHRGDAVAVAVEGEAHARSGPPPLLRRRDQGAHIGGNRLWVQTAKARVDLAVEFAHRTARAPQPFHQEPLPRAVHHIQHHPDAASPDGRDWHQLFEPIEPRFAGVKRSNFGLRIADCGLAGGLQPTDLLFDASREGHRGGPAIGGLALHPAILGGIVAGGDHHRPGRLQPHHGVREGGRRRKRRRQTHAHPLRRHRLGRGLGKFPGEKPRVVPHQDVRGCAVRFGADPSRDGPRRQSDVGEGEVVRDHPAPAIGSELDVGHAIRIPGRHIPQQRGVFCVSHPTPSRTEFIIMPRAAGRPRAGETPGTQPCRHRAPHPASRSQ